MKNFIVCLLLFSSASALAAPATPIRNGRFKAEIVKLEVRKSADGSYTHTNSPVCTIEGIAPVYDLRTGSSEEPTLSYSECSSTLDGLPAKIKVGGAWTLELQKLFSDESETELKGTLVGIEVISSSVSQEIKQSGSASRDLSVRSAVDHVNTDTIETCREAQDGSGDMICERQTGEFFYALLELKD